MTRRPPVLVVGLGRLGGALALGLVRSHWSVAVLTHSSRSARRATAWGLPRADAAILPRASLCVLAVPDSAVTEVAQQLASQLPASVNIVHCAGALNLAALGPLGRRPRGSFHPLCAISHPSDSLSGFAVALSASRPALMKTLERMAADLGLFPIRVRERERALYHAGAVLGAGGLVALASAASLAFERAGLSRRTAARALLPLMRSALEGAEGRGFSEGLTGPLARGDVDVVKEHLRALPEEISDIYRALALRALKLVGHRWLPKAQRDLTAALQATRPHRPRKFQGG